ncbi:hypothetical protein ALQ67_04371, partial [Pseudomonas savastanoi pv. glycinea]
MALAEPSAVVVCRDLLIFFFMSLKRVDEAPFSEHGPAGAAPRDAAAEARIKEHLTRQPAAPYYMTQAILVQEAAVNQLNQQVKQRDEQIQQLQAELQQAKGQSSSAPASGGFLSSIFGSSASRAPQAQPAQASGGGWRDGAGFNPAPAPAAPQGGYAAPAPAAGSGFLGGALKTAAGVAGGVLL